MSLMKSRKKSTFSNSNKRENNFFWIPLLSNIFVFKNRKTDCPGKQNQHLVRVHGAWTWINPFVLCLLFLRQYGVTSVSPTFEKLEGLWPNQQRARKPVKEYWSWLNIILSRKSINFVENVFWIISASWNFWTYYSLHCETHLFIRDLPIGKRYFLNVELKMSTILFVINH